jgi:hypothetical protein
MIQSLCYWIFENQRKKFFGKWWNKRKNGRNRLTTNELFVPNQRGTNVEQAWNKVEQTGKRASTLKASCDSGSFCGKSRQSGRLPFNGKN